jgi:hypothetical protein
MNNTEDETSPVHDSRSYRAGRSTQRRSKSPKGGTPRHEVPRKRTVSELSRLRTIRPLLDPDEIHVFIKLCARSRFDVREDGTGILGDRSPSPPLPTATNPKTLISIWNLNKNKISGTLEELHLFLANVIPRAEHVVYLFTNGESFRAVEDLWAV